MLQEIIINDIYHDNFGPAWSLVCHGTEQYLLNLRLSLQNTIAQTLLSFLGESAQPLQEACLTPEQLSLLSRQISALEPGTFYRKTFFNEETLAHILFYLDPTEQGHLILLANKPTLILEQLLATLPKLASCDESQKEILILPQGLALGLEAALLFDSMIQTAGADVFLKKLQQHIHGYQSANCPISMPLDRDFQLDINDLAMFRFSLIGAEHIKQYHEKRSHQSDLLLALPGPFSQLQRRAFVKTLLHLGEDDFPKSTTFLRFSSESFCVHLLRTCIDEAIADEKNIRYKALIAAQAMIATGWEQDPVGTYMQLTYFLLDYGIDLVEYVSWYLKETQQKPMTRRCHANIATTLTLNDMRHIIESAKVLLGNNTKKRNYGHIK